MNGSEEKEMTKPTHFVGPVWVLRGKDGSPIDDIDTDMIFHNAHLAIVDIKEMGQHAMGNLKGWYDFSKKARPGHIIIAGRNFGCGSSRQQAVDCFISLGISILIAESFGAIYKRNAINSGFPVLECPNILRTVALENGDQLRVDVQSGKIFNITKQKGIAESRAWSKVQLDVYQAGNLFQYARKHGI
jgi:3-isopropylmalate/(R)-2-methylmalate dehydratase small subunit